MKCGALDKRDLARAYEKAANDAGAVEVTMEYLAPHLAETGSSCGACPALLVLARKAFESHKDELGASLDTPAETPPANQIPVLDVLPTRDA